ncbi:hypothetical protein C8Q79DRAFT_1012970 [Trametes meyenii]|nr:hypothetical protein C8Q79DRAFT_1012970 [Trametes meyenii]
MPTGSTSGEASTLDRPKAILDIVRMAKLLADEVGGLEECISAVDLEVAFKEVQAAYVALGHKLNDRAPIHRLPPEILLKVFLNVLQLPPDNEGSPYARPDPRMPKRYGLLERACGPFTIRNVWDLGPILEVCVRWYTLVVGASSLWSSLFLSSDLLSWPYVPDSSRFLSRCSSGPLDVFVAFQREYDRDNSYHDTRQYRILKQYADRLRELHIRYDHSLPNGGIPAILQTPNASLERLAVVCNCKRPYWLGALPLFGGRRLQLRSLALYRAPFLPSNRLDKTLTHFLLDRHGRSHYPPLHSPGVDDLLRFFANAPLLQEIYINCQSGPRPGATIAPLLQLNLPPLPVKLAYMTKFRLRIRTSGYVPLLLPNLDLSRACHVALSTVSNDDLAFIPHYIARRFSGEVHSLHLYTNGGGMGSHISIQIPSRSSGCFRLDLAAAPPPNVDAEEHKLQILRSLFSTSPFTSVRTLWSTAETPNPTFNTAKLLSETLTGVQTLYLCNAQWDYDEFKEAALEPREAVNADSEVDSRGPLLIPFPSMQTFYTSVARMERFDLLVAAFRARAKAGYCIPCLRIGYEDSRLQDHDVEILRNSLEGCAREIDVFNQDVYRAKYSFEHVVLPAACTAKEEVHDYWPVWEEATLL